MEGSVSVRNRKRNGSIESCRGEKPSTAVVMISRSREVWPSRILVGSWVMSNRSAHILFVWSVARASLTEYFTYKSVTVTRSINKTIISIACLKAVVAHHNHLHCDTDETCVQSLMMRLMLFSDLQRIGITWILGVGLSYKQVSVYWQSASKANEEHTSYTTILEVHDTIISHTTRDEKWPERP